MSKIIIHPCVLMYSDGTYGQLFNKSSWGSCKVVDPGCKVLDHATVFTPTMQREQPFKAALKQGFTIVHAYEVRKVYIGIASKELATEK